jgi:hypothetical protein
VLATDEFETIRTTVEHLLAQTARQQLELVIVAPSAEVLRPDRRELRGFGRVRVVEADTPGSLAEAQAAGVRAARTPAIAFAETHCFPEPGWAAALIEAHRHPHAAVGVAFGNANPERVTSWANFFVDFGPWVDPVPDGPVDSLSHHNTSYKRSLLLDYEDELSAMLEAETVMQWDLRARGHELYLEPAAKTEHMNMTRILPSLHVHLLHSCTFAAIRARSWSPLRRLLYAVGSPLIVGVRLPRAVRDLRRAGPSGLLPRALIPMLAIASACAAGELIGYASRRRATGRRYVTYELHRKDYSGTSSASSALEKSKPGVGPPAIE